MLVMQDLNSDLFTSSTGVELSKEEEPLRFDNFRVEHDFVEPKHDMSKKFYDKFVGKIKFKN